MGKKQQISLDENQILFVTNCAGDCVVQGWKEAFVEIKGDDLNVEKNEKGVSVSSSGYLKIRVPTWATLDVETVHGNLTIKRHDGPVRAGQIMGNATVSRALEFVGDRVHGNVRLSRVGGRSEVVEVMGSFSARRIGSLKLGTAHGEVDGRGIAGPIEIERVDGEVNIKGATGEIRIEAIAGSASLSYINGSVHLDQVAGDTTLRGLVPTPAVKSVINTHGDLTIRWDVESPAHFLINYGGDLHNRLLKEGLMDLISDSQGTLEGRIGADGPTIVCEAGGDVMLKAFHGEENEYNFYFDGDDFSVDLDLELDEIGDRVSSHLEQIGVQLEQNLGQDFAGRITQKVESAIEKVAAKLEKAQRRSRRGQAYGYAYATPKPPVPPMPPAPPSQPKPEPDRSSEQMKILEMLERGDISVEDANMLLKALES